jgi:hypothetical protein
MRRLRNTALESGGEPHGRERLFFSALVAHYHRWGFVERKGS